MYKVNCSACGDLGNVSDRAIAIQTAARHDKDKHAGVPKTTWEQKTK